MNLFGLRETRPTRHVAGMFWAHRVVIVASWNEMFESCSPSRAVCAASRSAALRPPEPTDAVTIRLTCRTLGDAARGQGDAVENDTRRAQPEIASVHRDDFVGHERDRHSAPVSPADAGRCVQVELVAEDVRIQDEGRELIAAEACESGKRAVACAAPEHLEDAHPDWWIPLERVDRTKGRGVEDREPIAVGTETKERRAEVAPRRRRVDVDGDPTSR